MSGTILPGSTALPYASFSGWQIVPMPTAPAPRQVDFSQNDTVGEVTSPFTFTGQHQYWAGGDYWKLNVSLPSMPKRQADKWIGWFGALRGKTNVFQFGPPEHRYPSTYGTINALSPVIDGANNSTSIMIATRGWTPNYEVLNPGDYIQIGYRLYLIVGPPDAGYVADADGKCTLEIWPSLREALTDGVAITFVDPQGMFRLQDNERQYSAAAGKPYALSFKAVEAR